MFDNARELRRHILAQLRSTMPISQSFLRAPTEVGQAVMTIRTSLADGTEASYKITIEQLTKDPDDHFTCSWNFLVEPGAPCGAVAEFHVVGPSSRRACPEHLAAIARKLSEVGNGTCIVMPMDQPPVAKRTL